jgi:hypothetical protein
MRQTPHYYAPETPDLDNPEPMNIVSAGSHRGGASQNHPEGVLLPKRKEEYDHLFIPRALS